MKCSKCNEDFKPLKIADLSFEYCPKCHAIWIKFPMLKKMSEKLDLETPIINPAEMEAIKVKEELRPCPDCTKNMDKVYFNGIIVDKCSACNGILFDNGELSKFFNLFLKNKINLMGNIDFVRKYCSETKKETKEIIMQEIEIQSKEKERKAWSMSGFLMIPILLIWAFIVFLLFISGAFIGFGSVILAIILGVPLIFSLAGFKLLKPQEAMVLTVFGKYVGTLKGAGFHYVNPFAVSVTPFVPISLKARTLDNGKQKINDELGNPIEVGIIVIWEVQDTAKAVFNVEDYTRFLSTQCDSALRNIVRIYPYDTTDDSGKQSLRGDSQEISEKLKAEIQRNVKVAGLNVIDAKITHLAYAPEIAVAMLQRQQAAAIIDAKKTIVEGAVSMVEMALNKLYENNIVKLEESEKAKMVNNLLVTLCSNKEAQPVIKNGLG